jgi:Arc/MetJ-type ribon-helix-helix transcriptional regulator
MAQAKFSLTEDQLAFLDQHRHYGFRDRSELVRTALSRLKEDLEKQALEESARLYAELYEDDQESRQWVSGALREWPE